MYKRVALAFFGLMLVFGLLISRLGAIGLGIGSTATWQGTNSKSIELGASRGMIYDCNMERLVNTNNSTVTVCLPTTNAFNTVSGVVDHSKKTQIYENMSSGKVSVISTTQKFELQDIRSTTVTKRYTENQPCVHLIGHLDENGDGAMGLERAYNNYLSGQGGTVRAKWSVDALGHILLGEGIEFEKNNYLSPAGIQLTIDLNIQTIIENALKNHNIDKGACVVLNADTCELLGCASMPIFNPSDISEAMNSTASPFINRALTPYSVGSVFKPFVALSALESNLDFIYNCKGVINVGGTVFRCNNSTAHGLIDMTVAMEKSCNCYFIAFGQQIGEEKLLKLCSSMGLGKSVELADNYYLKSGLLPDSNKINSPQALANLCFGQGELLVSPLQMAVAYACIANGGYYRAPTLMKGIVNENGDIIQRVELPVSYKVINEHSVNKLDSILESVVTNGNANKAYSDKVKNYGKTATAQSGWFEEGREINHTWFCGYFTHENVSYVVVIFKEEGVSGAVDCAPVFCEISESIAQL